MKTGKIFFGFINTARKVVPLPIELLPKAFELARSAGVQIAEALFQLRGQALLGIFPFPRGLQLHALLTLLHRRQEIILKLTQSLCGTLTGLHSQFIQSALQFGHLMAQSGGLLLFPCPLQRASLGHFLIESREGILHIGECLLLGRLQARRQSIHVRDELFNASKALFNGLSIFRLPLLHRLQKVDFLIFHKTVNPNPKLLHRRFHRLIAPFDIRRQTGLKAV